jgi:hypothetical protein
MTVERYHPALVVLHWLLGGLIVLGPPCQYDLRHLPPRDQ